MPSILSAAVAKEVGEEPNLMQDTHGFALGSTVSGIHGVGILYGSDVEIISRDLNEVTGYYDVSYPTSAGTYGEFADALASLFETPGVTNIAGGSTTNTPSMKITQLFANNQILLGGVICAGNLEQTEYQTMNAEGAGFGVAPVPLYMENPGEEDNYLTAIHNTSRPGAIAKNTKNFTACTAFLDYQSTHSQDILDEYYTQELAAKTSQGLAGKQNNIVDLIVTLFNDYTVTYTATTNEDVLTKTIKIKNPWRSRGFMFKKLNILDEKDSRLRKTSVDAKLPLSKEYKDISTTLSKPYVSINNNLGVNMKNRKI